MADQLLTYMPAMLGTAVLLPLVSFFVILAWGNKLGKNAAYLATAAIVGAGLLSYLCLFAWLGRHYPVSSHHDAHGGEHANAADSIGHADEKHNEKSTEVSASTDKKPAYTGTYWLLGQFGKLQVTISYYIDSLTLVMFCMVTLIASCIHFYAIGYMHDELHDVTDHEVTLRNGQHLHRPGRFHRFFQYLSLFCFSMLGLVLAGNVAMVFVFWELVGACSYFLIGFYTERKSASNAANKAFIVNRVGDFGMIIGLMALWTGLGTFAFGDIDGQPGIFSQVRPADQKHKLTVPPGMVTADAREEIATIWKEHAQFDDVAGIADSEIKNRITGWRHDGLGYWLLVVAGLGIFCGCVGKSAQFPLHVWLPDAMEGPTPVSALVHSATMVAAGVYLVGRFFPVFAPEVLLVIAITGCITLFLAATIAITATDIKRVLAYSTVSQLGYMMLSLGVGGWLAGLMHLITHAFFKSLLFMCSGSVIHAVHTNDMRNMGGLLRKMPVTAITMLIGCLAIAGVGVPFVIGFSGYYSKDRILEQAYSLALSNSSALASVFFVAAAGGAAMTSFYMFRMWYMTFVGKPRDQHAYDHAHESPPVMFVPLIVLAVFAISVAWNFSLIGYGAIPAGVLIFQGVNRGWFRRRGSHSATHDSNGHDDHGHDAHGDDHASAHAAPAHDTHGHGHEPAGLPWTVRGVVAVVMLSVVVGWLAQQMIPNSSWNDLTLANLLDGSRSAGTDADEVGKHWIKWTWPNEHAAHFDENYARIVVPVTLLATGTWIVGIALATMMYGLGYLNPEDARRQFSPIYRLLVNKWWFDELYEWLFVKPTHVIARFMAGLDRNWLDWFIDGLAKCTKSFAKAWEYVADQTIVDGLANLLAGWTHSVGLALREVQTGKIRQYVMFIVIGAVAVFVLISFFWSTTQAH